MRLQTYIKKAPTEIKPPKQPEYIPFFDCMSNDVDIYYKKLMDTIINKGFTTEVLGSLFNEQKDDILLISRITDKKNPHLLIAGSFHGDEPAGSWGILKYLQLVDTKETNIINLSFLPLINPSGLRLCTRLNYLKEDPNRNYWKNNSIEYPSEEGRILLRNLEKLKKLSKNGFITMHEDDTLDGVYLVTYMGGKFQHDFIETIQTASDKYIPVCKGDIIQNDVADNLGIIKNGILQKEKDGSFEDFLFNNHNLITAVTETPSKEKICDRIDTNVNIIKEIVKFISVKG